MISYLGNRSVGTVCLSIGLVMPSLLGALTDVASRVDGLRAQITANTTFVPDPTQLLAGLASAASVLASKITDLVAQIPATLLEANVSLGLEVAGLLAYRDALKDTIALLEGAASAGGLHAYAVDSTCSAVGGELSSHLLTGLPAGLGPLARVRGIVLLTESPATVAALGKVLALT